jgi:hypothetical protein
MEAAWADLIASQQFLLQAPNGRRDLHLLKG